MSSALVLFSGGQDSTTCLFWAKRNFSAVRAIAFNYGQRHKAELEAAKQIAEEANVDLSIFQIDLLGQLTENALTSQNIAIEEDKPDNRTAKYFSRGKEHVVPNLCCHFCEE